MTIPVHTGNVIFSIKRESWQKVYQDEKRFRALQFHMIVQKIGLNFSKDRPSLAPQLTSVAKKHFC